VSKRLRPSTPLATYFIEMVAITDILEADHGWSFEQSDRWLERMGLWQEEF
jgi:hypothetical protein